MVEQALIFSLGFLTALLLSLWIMSLLWKRAVRLTTKRVEARSPLTLAQINADKDHLRAEHAQALRKVEMDAAIHSERANAQLIEASRLADQIRGLKADLAARQEQITVQLARIAELEASEKSLQAQTAKQSEDLEALETVLEQRELELSQSDRELAAKTREADGHRVEIVTLITKLDHLSNRSQQLAHQFELAQQQLSAQKANLDEVGQALTQARLHGNDLRQQLDQRIADISTLQAQKAELEGSYGQLTETTARLNQSLLQEQQAHGQTQTQLQDAQTTADTMGKARDAMNEQLQQAQQARENALADLHLLEGSLAQARNERERLQKQLIDSQKSADMTALRNTISDIAARIAHMTAQKEGEASPIKAQLKAAPRSKSGPPTLADRIHDLDKPSPRKARPKRASP